MTLWVIFAITIMFNTFTAFFEEAPLIEILGVLTA